MSEDKRIRVLVVDDHPMTRIGLVYSVQLYPDLEVVGDVGSGEEALESCATLRPDVILMDLKLRGMNGVEATRRIRERFPEIRIVALTSFDVGELIEEMLRAGATGYLLKDVSGDEIADAVRGARAGRAVLSPKATAALIHKIGAEPSTEYGLTEREQEVLELLAAGASTTQIAERLQITTATVKFHISGILSKLGVSTRAEAISIAWRQRLVQLPDQPATLDELS